MSNSGSSIRGSKIFPPDRKSIVRIITLILLCVGIVAAALFAYQQLTRPPAPNLISENEAITITIREANWDERLIETTRATLLHVKENGFAFVVDEKSFQDTFRAVDKIDDKYNGYYIWKVQLESGGGTANYYEWESWINAATGEVLLSAVNGSVVNE